MFTATLAVETLQAQTTGKASYYGNKFHGRRTSSGERYHRDSLTCAHKSLPFGTLLKVRNLKNGEEVVVKVTDRGPFAPGRVVDLSFAAAKELNMLAAGVVKVEVTNLGHIDELGSDANRLTAQAKASQKSHMLPEPKFIDPATGIFYTMDEWKQRGEEARRRHMAELARKSKPRYRILHDRYTAKNINIRQGKN